MTTYSIKAVKTFDGMEGGGFECRIYKHGKPVGRAFNSGCGGENEIELDVPKKVKDPSSLMWTDKDREYMRDLYEEMDIWARKFVARRSPSDKADRFKWTRPSDMAIDILVDDHLHLQRIKRICRTKTLFRDGGKWYTLKGKGKGVSEALKRKHAGLDIIANDMLKTDPQGLVEEMAREAN